MQGAYVRSLPALACLLTALPVAAQGWEEQPAFAATPAQLLQAAATLPIRAAYPVQELLEDTTLRLDAEGRRTVRYRYVFRINQESGIGSWGTVTAPWSPWFEEKPVIRARVITPDGIEHKLDPGTIGDFAPDQSGDMFSDRRELRAPLPKLAKGVLAEVEILSREHRPFARSGARGTYTLWQPVPVQRTRFALELPASLPFRWKLEGLNGIQARPQTQDGQTALRLDLGPSDPPRRSEPHAVPEQNLRPQIVYSTCPDWMKAVEEYRSLVEGQLTGADVKAWAKPFATETGPLEERLRKILMRLHKEVRYTGLEFGEASVVPRAPSETLVRGYGDCKDKSTLLVAILRELGIPAHVALLRTGPGRDTNSEFPGLAAFDHAIVFVPGPQPLWIDPTVPEAAPGVLPIPDLGRQALVIAPAPEGGLHRTPSVTSAQNSLTETREVFLAEEGPGRIVETTEATGPAEIALRDGYAGAEAKKVRENLKQYAENVYKAKDLGQTAFAAAEDLARPFRLSLEALKVGIAQTGWSDAAVALNYWPLVQSLGQMLHQQPANEPEEEAQNSPQADKEPAPRRTGFQLDAPSTTIHRWIVHPPQGFTADALPPNRTLEAGPARISLGFTRKDDGSVEAVYRLEHPRTQWTAAEVNQARAALKTLGEEKIPMLAFHQEGELHLSAGRHKEALESFRKLHQVSPNQAGPLVRQARALLSAGFGDAARSAIARAIALEPKLSLAHQNLGWILEHDSLGRRFRPGWDRKGALEAYRKAIELEPANRDARHSLAILLEHTEHGERYVRGKDLEAAVPLYEGLIKEEKNETLQDGLTLCLAYLHRFEEARTVAQGREPGPRRNGWLLAMDVCIQGLDKALERSKSLFPDLATRRATYLGAADVLVRFRKYSEAGRLLQEGANGSTEMAQVRARAELLERVRRHETLPRDPGQPATAARGMLLATMDLRMPRAQVEASMTRAQRSAAVWEDFTQARKNQVAKLHQQDLPGEVLMDIALSIADLAVDGNDARGYLVRTEIPGQNPETMFLAREEDQVRAVGNELTDLARQAFWHGGRGELEPGRAWLDHLVEYANRGSSEDPLTEHVTRRLWEKGKAGSAAEIQLAAAATLAYRKEESEAYAFLTKAFQEHASGPRAVVIAQSLAMAATGRKDLAVLDQASERLLALAPNSTFAHNIRVGALALHNRWEDAIQVLDHGLKTRPEDAGFQSMRSHALERAGRGAEMEKAMLDRIQRGKADPMEYNNLAWFHVAKDKVTAQTLEFARKGILGDGARSDASHHTLAAVLAASGRTQEALEMLRKAMSLRDEEKATDADYYVLGRIAEHLGEREVALGCYRKVQPDPERGEEGETGCPAMARKRLEALSGR